MEQTVTSQDVCKLLNEAAALDPAAVTALITTRVPCNHCLADHPTICVATTESGEPVIGLLGILNGLFGLDDNDQGPIGALLPETPGEKISFHLNPDFISQSHQSTPTELGEQEARLACGTAETKVDFSEVEIGIVVDLDSLRRVLKGLSVDGKRWWISSDPSDAADTGFICVGYGDRRCSDRLNTMHFRLPVVGNAAWKAQTDRLIVLFEPTTLAADVPSYYRHDDEIVEDPLEDFESFFQPVKSALVARLQSQS